MMSSRIRSLSRVKRGCHQDRLGLLVDRATVSAKLGLDAICDDIAALKARGTDVLVVSSGAIALGRTVLDMPSAP